MSQCNYCDTGPTTGFPNNGCAVEEGGIVAAGYLKCDSYPLTNLDSANEWQALLDAGDAFPIFPVRGSDDDAWTQNTGEGYGFVLERNTTKTITVTYSHPGVNTVSGGTYTAREFYNLLTQATGSFYFWWVLADGTGRISTSTVRVEAKPKSGGLEGTQEWEAMAKWTAADFPEFFEAPVALYSA